MGSEIFEDVLREQLREITVLIDREKEAARIMLVFRVVKDFSRPFRASECSSGPSPQGLEHITARRRQLFGSSLAPCWPSPLPLGAWSVLVKGGGRMDDIRFAFQVIGDRDKGDFCWLLATARDSLIIKDPLAWR